MSRPRTWAPVRFPAPALVVLVALVALLVPARPVAADGEVRVSAEVSPRVVGVGEAVRLTLVAEGPGFVTPRLRPRFDPGHLEIVSGPNVNHGLTLTDGGGWRYSWSWWLVSRRVGPAAVTDVHLLVDDERFDLPTSRIEVVAQKMGGAEPPRTRLEAIEELFDRTRDRLAGERSEPPPDAFLRAVATPTRPFVGQRVVYTLYLYNRTPVTSITSEGMNSFQGLWARTTDVPRRLETVDWRGHAYTRHAIQRWELYALAARPRRIEPLRIRTVLRKAEKDRSLFFPTWRSEPVMLTSNPVDLDVRPLPPGGPRSEDGEFPGAVGELAVAAAVEPAELEVGESATLTVTVAGEGHLEALPAPRIATGDGIEVLGPRSPGAGEDAPGELEPLPTPRSEPGVEGGERTWQYLLVPRRAGSWNLPAVEVPYFDPEAERYDFARASLPVLRVKPAPAALVADEVAPSPVAPEPEGWADRILASLDLDGTDGWKGAWPWAAALLAIPFLWLLATRRRSGAAGEAGAGGLCEERLAAAIEEDRPRRAAAALEGAWRELLDELYGVPATVPTARWADEALARGADRSACRDLRRLADDLHYLRFAPELSETRSLTSELAARSRALARRFAADRHGGAHPSGG